MTKAQRRALLIGGLALAMAGTAPAETRPTLNFYGQAGLIDMPSAEVQPDGYLGFSTARFGPISKTSVSFQLFPRMTASFRYSGTRHWNDLFCPPDCAGANKYNTYFDRGFDLRFQILKESQYLPALSVGFQDIAGTGLQAGEYLVATKHLGGAVKVTAGLGWGRLATHGPIGAPFGPRPPIDLGQGGNFNTSQWFRGDVAPFGGVEWQINDKWGVKAEYSSDAYVEESGFRQTFANRSPFNFGIEYQRTPAMRLGAYYLYGSELGLAMHLVINPNQRPAGGMGGTGPEPVLPRPPRAADPEFWSAEWVTQPGVNAILTESLAKHVERSGILIEALAVSGDTAQVWIRNVPYDAPAQAVGRVARAMSQVMPASVETFEIVPVENGVPATKVTIARTDIETLEFAPDGAALLRERVAIGDPGQRMPGLAFNPKIYPRFKWSLGPYTRISLFNVDGPIKADLGLRLAADYELAPGLVFSGAVTKKLIGNLGLNEHGRPTNLPPVRTDVDRYDAFGDPGIESLTAAWYGRLGTNLYGRVTAGYLERMFGGVSGEVLWRPVNRPWALGAEVNYVAQRDTDQGLGFGEYDYAVATGHVSGYLELGAGYHAQIDVGRYLAGDVGGTLSIDREFENGWKIGAYATLTDVSAADFGEGSFDKGVRLEIPVAWFTGRPTRSMRDVALRSITRDGGARLEVEGRLYDTLRVYDGSGIDAQWGRFWK